MNDDSATRGTLLRLAGRDALDVLHRVTTAHLADLVSGQARWTLFCDFRGRLQHRALVTVAADGAVWLLRDDAPAESLVAAVDRAVFREDVRIEDRGAGRFVRRVWRPDATPATPLDHAGLLEDDGLPRIVQTDDGEALEVLGEAVEPTLDAERARIEAGWPRHGHEIAEAFHPFEVGLARDVHLSKGCYTGQEVLLRLMTYHSVRRRLVRLRGEGDAPTAGAEVRHSGDGRGVITSAIAVADGWRALAVLPHAAAEPGASLAVDGAGPITAIEPFPETRPLGLPE
jgi:folate-binding protein YgfZ